MVLPASMNERLASGPSTGHHRIPEDAGAPWTPDSGNLPPTAHVRFATWARQA